MHRKTRKKRRVCSNCSTRFSGRYCPYCGAEYGHRHALRSSGFFVVLLRFLLSLAALALVLFVAFAALDYLAATDNGAHTTALAIVESVKNALPERWISVYESIKANQLDTFVAWTQSVLGPDTFSS